HHVRFRMERYTSLVSKLTSGSAAVVLKPGVKKIALNFCNNTRSHGARKDFPVLKYNNPNVEFSAVLPKEPIKPFLLIELESGPKKIDITGMHSKKILQTMLESV
ncbi:hypothetical protein BB560_003572, partial [Smittium megazygosporum]